MNGKVVEQKVRESDIEPKSKNNNGLQDKRDKDPIKQGLALIQIA